MPALVAGIHVFTMPPEQKAWMAGTSPAMTRMQLFNHLKDDALFAAGAWRSLRQTMPIAKNPTRVFPLLMAELAARHGDKPALISDAETLSYRGLVARA